MLRPSYLEVMNAIDERGLIDEDLRSRYIVVIAAAKRARQLIDGAEPLTNSKIKKDVSIAIKEISENKLVISPMTEEQIAQMNSNEIEEETTETTEVESTEE